jgi:hypothetical protein
MNWEETIFGVLCIIWGIVLLLTRKELYGLARGRGLRDIRILRPLLVFLGISLPLLGILIIVLRGI